MKAFDFDAVVSPDGDVFCKECVPEGTKARDCDPIFADSEWDHAPVCVCCGAEHDYMTILRRVFEVTLRLSITDTIIDPPSRWDWTELLGRGVDVEQVSCREAGVEQKAGASLCCDDPACPDKQ